MPYIGVLGHGEKNFVRMDGLQDLDKRLHLLDYRVAKTAASAATKAGAQVFLDRALQNVPVDRGALKSYLAINTNMKPIRGRFTAKIGPKRVAGEDNQTPGAYGLMVEVGTKPHIITAHPGKQLWLRGNRFAHQVHHPGAKKKPYLQPAFQQGNQAALQVFMDTLKQAIEAAEHA